VKLQQQVDRLSGIKAPAPKGGHKSELEVAREQLRKLKAENDALRGAAEQNVELLEDQHEEARRQQEARQNGRSKSCTVQ